MRGCALAKLASYVRIKTSAGFPFYRVQEPTPPFTEEQLHILHSIKFYKLTTVWSAILFKIAHRPIWSASGGLLSLSLRKGCFLKGSVVKMPTFTPSLVQDGVPGLCLGTSGIAEASHTSLPTALDVSSPTMC